MVSCPVSARRARSYHGAVSEEVYGGAGESRTPDTQFRKLLLYPSELQPLYLYGCDSSTVVSAISVAVYLDTNPTQHVR